MLKGKELIGKKIGKITILSVFKEKYKGRSTPFFSVQCECGKQYKAGYGNIMEGRIKNCRSCRTSYNRGERIQIGSKNKRGYIIHKIVKNKGQKVYYTKCIRCDNLVNANVSASCVCQSCYWATSKRKKLIQINGVLKSVSEWARHAGVTKQAVSSYYKKGGVAWENFVKKYVIANKNNKIKQT